MDSGKRRSLPRPRRKSRHLWKEFAKELFCYDQIEDDSDEEDYKPTTLEDFKEALQEEINCEDDHRLLVEYGTIDDLGDFEDLTYESQPSSDEDRDSIARNFYFFKEGKFIVHLHHFSC